MTKIVHIIGRLRHGGAEKLLLDLCRKVDKEKFDVSVIVLQEDNPMAEEFLEAGIKIKFFHKKNKLDFGIIKRVADYLRDLKPDIVHTHLFAGDFWGGSAAIRAKVPHIVSTKHDILYEDFMRSFLTKRMHRKFERIIAISNATRDFMLENENVPFEKIQVIYNGVDITRYFEEISETEEKDNIVIGTIGRLSKEKGQKHLIRACRFLKDADWELILVGEGPMREELQNLAHFLGIENKVKFTGFAPDVRPYLQKFDIFVLPSVSEGLSIVILEAALRGKFIIATNVGGIPEIITDKETGLLFEPKNIEQLVRHLNWAIEHRADAAKMARRLQKEVMEKFDIKKTVNQYESFYKELMENKKI
ncbi:glycosyltransferase [Patescibacteria group bacterium]|nr:glycosyltransferase [Patescibacteria group bacterium]